MGTAATEILEHARPGRVSTVFCLDIAEARGQLRAAAEQLSPPPTLVALEWSQVPALARELTEIRDALADAALSLWPDWYLTAEARFGTSNSTAAWGQAQASEVRLPAFESRASEAGLEQLERRAVQSGTGVSRSWLQAAFRRCQRGRRPVLRNRVAAEQVRQLALALDPTRLTFALSVESSQGPRARMRGLAKAAEWLASESGAKTLLLVPSEWQSSTELDPVSYGAVWLEQGTLSATALSVVPAVDRAAVAPRSAEVGLPPPVAPQERQLGSSSSAGDRPGQHSGSPSALEVPGRVPPVGSQSGPPRPSLQVQVGPIVGRPHPGSLVEKLICERLSSDAELSGLFEFNQVVLAYGGMRYVVDLLWRQGGLVVELDGPEHNGRFAYVRDRDRDYRLFMSGFATLRIPNDEVYVDENAVLTKIRNVVQHVAQRKEGSRAR